jgi:hypothetical protein
LPDFSWCNVTKRAIIYQNIANGHEPTFNFQDPSMPKYTQSGIFGMKIYHLATLTMKMKGNKNIFI